MLPHGSEDLVVVLECLVLGHTDVTVLLECFQNVVKPEKKILITEGSKYWTIKLQPSARLFIANKLSLLEW